MLATATTTATYQTKPLLDEALAPYAKLWPLYGFNACNPLVGLEHMPFAEALHHTENLLGHNIGHNGHLFAKLFHDNAFAEHDLNDVIERYDFTEGHVQSISVESYQSLCRKELLALIKTADKPLGIFSAHEKEQLLKALEPLSQLQQQGQASQHLAKPQHQWIDEQITKYLAAYLDEGQALWPMPDKDEHPLLTCWANIIDVDNNLTKDQRHAIKNWLADNHSNDPYHTLGSLLGLLSPLPEYHELINDHLKQLPGWLGFLKYSESQQPRYQHIIAEYLIIRLLYHWQLKNNAHAQQITSHNSHTYCWVEDAIDRLERFYINDYQGSLPTEDFINTVTANAESWIDYFAAIQPLDQVLILLEALEAAQQDTLIYKLNNAYREATVNTSPQQNQHISAQAVFCIDVRSEPYRRALEVSSNIETYGFAGFFGLPIAKKGYTDNDSTPLCPILLEPQFSIPEEPTDADIATNNNGLSLHLINLKEQWTYAIKKIKRDTFGTFGYVEGLGFLHGISTFFDSFISSNYQSHKHSKHSRQIPKPIVSPNISDQGKVDSKGIPLGIPHATQIELAQTILKLMGLQSPFAEFVVICGHAGQAINNPYASALDCGACGANGGGYNAIVLCQILNNPIIRQALDERGVTIKPTTHFIAAEHNTTTDTMLFLNEEVVPTTQKTAFDKLKSNFRKASDYLSNARYNQLKDSAKVSKRGHIEGGAWDWSQTRPEWGLSKNQAFLIGQRQHIRQLGLEGRTFLHSYDWATDDDDSVLTTIMSAPMVVGTWINCQYLLSTLDQARFGSGKKYTHNVVGLFGTYQGNQSDLQLGLPYESLFRNDGVPYHYPQRLLVCIEAPMDKVLRIARSNEQVTNLIKNQWIKVRVIEPESQKMVSLLPGMFS